MATAKLLQSCPTLCNPIDGSPSGSAVPGILQARTLEWVAISFSNAWKWKVKVKSLSLVQLSGTPWTTAYQAPLSMGFSRQEYWSGVPLPSPQVGLAYCNSWGHKESDMTEQLNWTEWIYSVKLVTIYVVYYCATKSGYVLYTVFDITWTYCLQCVILLLY